MKVKMVCCNWQKKKNTKVCVLTICVTCDDSYQMLLEITIHCKFTKNDGSCNGTLARLDAGRENEIWRCLVLCYPSVGSSTQHILMAEERWEKQG